MFCIDLSFFIFLILDLSFELQSTHWVCFYFSQHVSGQIVSINLFKQFFAFILLKCVPAKANQQYRIRMQNSSVMRNVGCVGYVLYLLHSGKLSERLSSKTFFAYVIIFLILVILLKRYAIKSISFWFSHNSGFTVRKVALEYTHKLKLKHTVRPTARQLWQIRWGKATATATATVRGRARVTSDDEAVGDLVASQTRVD